MLRADAPVQPRLPVAIGDQGGEIRDATLDLCHRDEVMVAQHVAPKQRDAAPDVRPEPVRRDRKTGLRDEIERELGMIRFHGGGNGDCVLRRQPRPGILDQLRDARADLGAIEGRQRRGRLGQVHHRSTLELVQIIDRLNGVAAS